MSKYAKFVIFLIFLVISINTVKAGEITDSILLGQLKTYTLGDSDYEVKCKSINTVSLKGSYSINGQFFNDLIPGESRNFLDGLVSIKHITSSTDPNRCQFTLSTQVPDEISVDWMEVGLTIDNIYTSVSENDDDFGYISKIVFTISNGENKVLTPIVNVYVYDSEMDESWETRSRGEYTYSGGIKPDDKHTASIDLSPRTFRNLDLEKNIRLILFDANKGFVASRNEVVLIGEGETTTSETGTLYANKCTLPAGIACTDFKIESDKVTVALRNGMGYDTTNLVVEVEGCGKSGEVTLNNGEQQSINIDCTKLLSESSFSGKLSVWYTNLDSGLGHVAKGSLSGEVKKSETNNKNPSLGSKEIELTVINTGCFNCDTGRVLSILKDFFPNFYVTKLDYNSKEGQELAKRFNLNVLPAYVFDSGITKEQNWNKIYASFNEVNGNFVMKNTVANANYYIGREEMSNKLDLFSKEDQAASSTAEENLKEFLDVFGEKIIFEKHGAEDKLVKELEINSFPAFLVNNKIKFSGVQSANKIKENFCQLNDLKECDNELNKELTTIEKTIEKNIPTQLNINSIINQALKVQKSLKEGDKLEFDIFGDAHSITVDKVTSNSVTITLSSNPLTFIIELLKSIVVDINQDGIGDIGIKLNSVNNDIANLEFFKPSGNEPIATPTVKEDISTSKQPRQLPANLKYFIIGFLVLIVLGFGGYGTIKNIKKRPKKEKIKKEVKEETEEKPDKKVPFNKDVKETISVSNFTLKHGKNTILDNISFEVQKGEMVCLLGPSGTGKSTIIEALVGRKTPTKGTLKILGEDISKNKKIYDYVGFVPQGAELYMNQTVMQNLLSSATKWGIKDAQNKAEVILSKIELSNRKELKASNLSGGQQKLLSLGMELIRDIELCILDEPTTGLDPNTRNNIITILSQITTQLHKTIFFTTHFMDDAEECDQVIILADKKIVAQGPPSKLEKMLPGGGKVVNVILDNVTEDLLEKIEKIEGVKKVVREGRNLRILTNEPNAIKLGQKIDEIGGIVNETKVDKATMMEVFVYHTGSQLKNE